MAEGSPDTSPDMEVVIQKEEIVTFQDEGSVEQGTLALPVSMPEEFAASAREGRDHTVVDFLKRPMLLQNFLWKATITPGSDLFIINFPNDLFQQPAVYDKIKGFTWFRGEMVLRVNVNAQKFQQGRLLLYFIPYRFWTLTAPASDHLTTKSGYPRVDLDLAESQSMTIRLPFVAPMSHLNLIREEWAIGSVVATVYGQLAGGDAEIGGSVWGHFENVEINLPTGVLPYITPLTDVKTASIVQTFAQANLKGEKEQSGGVISSAARTVGKIAGVASMIPGLSTIAAPIAAVAGIAGNLASAFGYSKPVTEKLAEPVQIQTARNACNFNGIDMSKKLALDATNSISTDPIFGSGVDEMSLTYIAGTPNFYQSFNFTKTQTAGTVLYSTPVSPVGVLIPYKDYTNFYIFTHLAFIARMFDFWSGSIKYRLRFVKTKFHSGRIRVSVVPQAQFSGSVSTFDANKCISYVIDLKDKSEFEFDVPFTFNAPMMPTGAGGANNATPQAPAHSNVVITVLNELRTPSTLVSDTINVIVEKAGGDDIAFYVPRRFEGTIVYSDTGPPPSPPKGPIKQTFAQMDETREAIQLGRDMSVSLFNTERSDNPTDTLACVGETIVSARQLLKRFQLIANVDLPNAEFRPFKVGTYLSANPSLATIGDSTDYYTVFSSIFAFMRGSMRLKFWYKTVLDEFAYEHVVLGAEMQQSPTQSYFAASANPQYRDKDATVPNNPLRDGILEVEVPYYSQYPMSPTANSDFKAPPTFQGHPAYHRVIYYFSDAEGTNQKFTYRAVGEDFQFGFLIGAPPVRLVF